MNRRSLFALPVLLATAPLAAQPAPGSRIIAATLYDDYTPPLFAKLLASGRPFIIHVHADWCSACRMQEARLKSFLVDPAIRALPFVRVDFDADRDFLKRFRVGAQSTLIAFRGGKEVARSVGVVEAGRLRELVGVALQ